MYEETEQATSAGALATAVTAICWGADYTLNVVSGHIRLSTQGGVATAADCAQLGWSLRHLAFRGHDTLPVHIGVTLPGPPTDVHLRLVATDALLAVAEAAAAGSERSQRRWRTREARLLGEALATADRHRDEFLAVLAHELRSPLAAIRNAAHLACSPMTEDSARHKAQTLLERQLQRMTHLVDDLLDLSRFTLGHVPLNCERMDLRTAVSNAIETVEPDVRERDHRLTVALPTTPVWLHGDGRRLEQVFVNLLANACKFTATGGELAVRLHASGGRAIVQFRDSGVGIEAHALPHIFDPFKQGYHVARYLSQHPRLQNLRLIALTGSGDHPGRDRAREAGFERYLIAPPGAAELDELFT